MTARARLSLHLTAAFFAASSFVAIGVLLPEIIPHYDLTLAQAGVVPVVRGAGEIAAALLMAPIVRRIGERGAFMAGHALIALSYALMGLPLRYAFFLALLFAGGAGVQCIITPVTSMVGRLGGSGQGRSISVVFLVISAAIMVAPALIGWGLRAGADWRTILFAIGAILGALIPLQAAAGPLAAAPRDTTAKEPDAPGVYGDFGLWVTALILMIWVGSHGLFLVWLPTYAVAALEIGRETAGAPLSAYTLGILISRVGMVKAADRFSPRKLMIASATAATVLSVGVVTADRLVELMSFSFLVGLMNGGMTPLFFTFAGKRLGTSAEVFGFLFAAMLVSETLTPGVAGWVADALGLRFGIGIMTASLALTAALLALYPRITRDRGIRDQRASHTS